MKPILIAGGGLIGGAAAKFLSSEYRVHVLDTVNRADQISTDRGAIEYHEGSIANLGSVRSLIGRIQPVAIIHTAALLGPAFKADPVEGYRVNIGGAIALATCAVEAGVAKFVFASSLAVYDFDRGDCLLSEDAPKTLEDEYGLAKLFVEDWLSRFSKRRISTAILRFAGVYGPGPADTGGWSCGRLRAVAQDVVAAGGVVQESLFGTNEYLHVRDAASAIVDAVHCDRSVVCNIGSDALVTAQELVGAFNEAAPGKATYIPGDEGMPNYLRREYPLDTRHARRVLGYRPRVTINEGVAELVAFARMQQRSGGNENAA